MRYCQEETRFGRVTNITIRYSAYIDRGIVDRAMTVLRIIKSQSDRIFEARNLLHETCESSEHHEICDKP